MATRTAPVSARSWRSYAKGTVKSVVNSDLQETRHFCYRCSHVYNTGNKVKATIYSLRSPSCLLWSSETSFDVRYHKLGNLVKLTIKQVWGLYNNKRNWLLNTEWLTIILIYYKLAETYLLRSSRKRSDANKLWYLPPSRHLMASGINTLRTLFKHFFLNFAMFTFFIYLFYFIFCSFSSQSGIRLFNISSVKNNQF